MQIYVSGLIEIAGRTLVGATWVLDRDRVMIEIGITDAGFDDLQKIIERKLPGRWERYRVDGGTYVYRRLA